jgi:NAD(P)-dependent dehydrogenase (short-subunit alcohol dehydrogenase family)
LLLSRPLRTMRESFPTHTAQAFRTPRERPVTIQHSEVVTCTIIHASYICYEQNIDINSFINNNIFMTMIATVTGATRNLGFFLAQGLAQRLKPGDTVYLTGRDAGRVAESVARISGGAARVIGEVLDVSDRSAVERFAALLQERHGGVDIVFSNHYTRVQPEDDAAQVIGDYVAANNLGTTHILRSFAPLIRDGGRLLVVASRAGSLRALAPVLHGRFKNLESLDDVDHAICKWRDAVRNGLAAGQAWPAWINIPSKIGQVAAVRVLASQRRAEDLRRGILIAAISPGLIDTGASRRWLDMRGAATPEDIADPLLDLALDASPPTSFYGELVHLAKSEPERFRTIVPWT